MRQTSDLYKRLLAADNHVKENRLTIGGVIYDEPQIVTLRTDEALFAADTVSAGGAVARGIEFSAILSDNVPKRAEIVHDVRLRVGDEVSEWLQKGVYYIDTRSKDPLTGVTTVHGFDAMLTAEQEWKPAETDVFPMPMQEAVEKTAAILDIKLDPRNVFKTGSAYMVDYPVADGTASEEQQTVGLTIRQVWRWIAGAMGGNFIINDLGQLRLVPLNGVTSAAYLADENGDAITFGGDAVLLNTTAASGADLLALGNAAAGMANVPPLDPVSRIILKIGDNAAYVSGSDTALTLEIDCAYGNKTMADDLLAQLQGYVYQPMEAEDALIDPAAELGDPVEIGGVYTILAQKSTLWDALSAADIAAPGATELESEYGFTSAPESKYRYELAQARSLISKTNERISFEIYGEDGKGGLSGKMNTVAMALNGVAGTIKNYETTVAGYKEEVNKYSVDVEGFRSSIERYTSEVGGYKEETAKYEATLEGLRGEITKYSEDVTGYTEQNAKYTAAVEGFNATLGKYEQDVTGYKETVGEYTLKLDEYSGKLSEYEETVGGYTGRVNEFKGTVDGFDRTVKQYSEDVKGYSEQYSTISQKVDNIAIKIVNPDGKETSVKLSDGAIDLRGLVTFSSLSSAPGTGVTKINGGWIDADTLTVKAAKIEGTISTKNLSLSGVISFSDLSDYETVNKQIEDAADSGGYTKKQIKTFISDSLVASPEIRGGMFRDLGGEDETPVAELRLTYDIKSEIPSLIYEEINGRSNMFGILPATASSEWIGLVLGGQAIMIACDGSVKAYGTWDFSAANVILE